MFHTHGPPNFGHNRAYVAHLLENTPTFITDITLVAGALAGRGAAQR